MIFDFDENILPLGLHPDHTERTIERWIANAEDSAFCEAVANDQRGRKLLEAVTGNSPFSRRICNGMLTSPAGSSAMGPMQRSRRF